jgi:hypothetical protein
MGIFPWREDPHGKHGLVSLVEFRFKAAPGTSYSYITIHTSATTRRGDHEVHKWHAVANKKVDTVVGDLYYCVWSNHGYNTGYKDGTGRKCLWGTGWLTPNCPFLFIFMFTCISFRVINLLTQTFPSRSEQTAFLGDRILMTSETSFIAQLMLTSWCFLL